MTLARLNPLAGRPDAAQLEAIRTGRIVHRTRMIAATKQGGLVRRILWRDEHSAVCEVHIQATTGLYKNLTVEGLDLGTLAYTYFFLGDPDRFQIGMNIDNMALLPGWKPRPDVMMVRCRGEDILRAAGGVVWYRPMDKAVVIKGDYIGPATLSPVPHEIAETG